MHLQKTCVSCIFKNEKNVNSGMQTLPLSLMHVNGEGFPCLCVRKRRLTLANANSERYISKAPD